MSEPSAFRKELEAAVNARHSHLNPFTGKWVKGARGHNRAAVALATKLARIAWPCGRPARLMGQRAGGASFRDR